MGGKALNDKSEEAKHHRLFTAIQLIVKLVGPRVSTEQLFSEPSIHFIAAGSVVGLQTLILDTGADAKIIAY